MQKNGISNKIFSRIRISNMLLLFTAAHLVHHLLTALQIPLLPYIRSDFNMDYTQAGFVISAFTLSYGISQIPAGWLADRMGRAMLVTVGIVGVAISGLLVGISANFTMMIIFFILMGITGGAYHPASLPLLIATVESDKKGQALGLHMIGGAASYFLAPLFAAVIATAYGWRSPFIWLCIPTMIFGIFFYLRLRRWQDMRQHVNMKKFVFEKPDNHLEITQAPGHVRRLTSFIVLSSFSMAVSFSVIAFIPIYVVDHFDISEEMAAAIIALFYSAGLWASFVGGYLSDRFGQVPVTVVVCLLTGPFLYLLNIIPYGWGFSVLLVLLGSVNYMRFVTTEAYIIDHTRDKNRSTIIGIFYFVGMEGGGVVAPVLGYIIDKFGFYVAFTAAGLSVVVITIICSVFLRGHQR